MITMLLLNFCLLAWFTVAAAQSSSTVEVVDQSAPFNLVIHSQNKTLNGSFLAACHEGAALGALCALPKPQTLTTYGYQFQLNTTRFVCTWENGTVFPCSPSSPSASTIGQPGLLTWNEHYTGANNTPGVVSQSMQLINQGFSSNMAFAVIFFPEAGLRNSNVAFDSNGCMNLQDGLDPKHPGNYPDEGVVKAYYRWYMCWDVWMYYSWNHLVWVYGDDKPWDKTCESVDVKRIFV